MNNKDNLNYNKCLILTDGTNRDGQAVPSISKDGKLIYTVYTETSDKTNIAEFFGNNHGNLFSIIKLPMDSEFPEVQSGYSNQNFNRFTLLDENGIQGRLRLFDSNFTKLTERIVGIGVFFQGGVFSLDNKYISVSFVNQIFPQFSTLLILDSESLETIASTIFTGRSNGPVFIQFNHRTYILIGAVDTAPNPEQTLGFGPPAYITVYELKNNLLITIETKILPQYPRNYDVLYNKDENGKYVLIGVGTRAAFLPREKSLVVNNQGFFSFLPNDGDELKIFKFNGCRLKLIEEQNPNVSIVPLIFNQTNKLLAVGYVNEQLNRNINESGGFLTVYKIHNDKLKIINSSLINIPIPYGPFKGNFSQNGKWFVLGGTNASLVNISTHNNVLLYKFSC